MIRENFHFINEANWNSNVATVMSEEPHNLTVGSVVNVNKITSSIMPLVLVVLDLTEDSQS